MATVQELSVRVGADTGGFQAGAQRVESGLDDISSEAIQTAAALEVLSSRANDAEGEVRELGRGSLATSGRVAALGSSATSTAATLTGLSAASSAASVSFTSLANTPLLVALPVLTASATALLSTLFPLAAVAGTVAAALGGLGLVAVAGTLTAAASQTETLTSALEEAKTELLAVLEPLTDAFMPVILHVLDILPDVAEETLALTGGFGELAASMTNLIDDVADVLPELFATLIEFGEDALPVLESFVESLDGNVRPALRGMRRVAEAVAPVLVRFGREFGRVIPELTRLGTVVLRTVVPAFSDFLGLVENIIQIGEGSNSLVGFLSSLVNGALTWIESRGVPLIQQVGGNLVGALITAIQPTEEGGTGQLNALISRVGGWLDDLSAWVQGPGGTTITNTMRELFDALANALQNLSEEDIQGGVDALLGVVAGVFDSVSNAVASDEGGRVSQAIGRVTGDIMASFADSLVAYVRSDAFQEDLDQFANATEAAIEKSLRGMSIGLGDANFEVFGEEISIPLGFGQDPDRLPNPDTSSLADVREFVQGPNSVDGRRITQGERRFVENETPFTVEVTVDGDVGVVRDTAVEVVNEEQRLTRMNQGRIQTPR